jgi:hypothetical protein
MPEEVDSFVTRRMSHKEKALWIRGRCPVCLCSSLRDKGSFEACNDCGARLGNDENNRASMFFDRRVQDEMERIVLGA